MHSRSSTFCLLEDLSCSVVYVHVTCIHLLHIIMCIPLHTYNVHVHVPAFNFFLGCSISFDVVQKIRPNYKISFTFRLQHSVHVHIMFGNLYNKSSTIITYNTTTMTPYSVHVSTEFLVERRLTQTSEELALAKHTLEQKDGIIQQLKDQINQMDMEIRQLQGQVNHRIPQQSQDSSDFERENSWYI